MAVSQPTTVYLYILPSSVQHKKNNLFHSLFSTVNSTQTLFYFLLHFRLYMGKKGKKYEFNLFKINHGFIIESMVLL